MLEIDGSMGEGGGQVLRTSLSLAALTGRPFRLQNIRANRSKPGLRPQHLTAVHAVASICQAHLVGDQLNATTLEFQPQSAPLAGEYIFDVSDAAKGGSAGAVTLILQAVLWPLLFADGRSTLTLRGGTHVPFSPPYHYIAEVVQPVVARLGATFSMALQAWGWYPAGGGIITAVIDPISHLQAVPFALPQWEQVQGIAAVTNLPAHISQRMAKHAADLLRQEGLHPAVQEVQAQGVGQGTGLFLWLPQAGFSSLGRRGLAAEKVAETAVAQLRTFIDNTAQVDPHLADQLLLPLALSRGSTTFTTNELTLHTVTNARLLRQWLDTAITIEGEIGQPGQISVTGNGFSRVFRYSGV